MSRKHHYIKCETQYYQAVERGEKKFELRLNDRDYKKHDLVYLDEFANSDYTGRRIGPFEIQYIMYGPIFGLAEGWCIFNW